MDARRFGSLLVSCLIASEALHADPIPLAIERGGCTFNLRAENANASWWLVLGNRSLTAKSATIQIRCEATGAEPHVPRCDDAGPSSAWRALRREQLARWQQAARNDDDAPLLRREPARTRGFWMLQRDRDLGDPTSYVHAKATLVATGSDCIVYLDDEETCDDRLRALAASVVRAFDEDVLPWMTRHLGRAVDVDRDGRFCIFLTPRVATMQGTAGSLQGFVRGSDFYRDLESPFGNRCDMMYVSSKAASGATLKALLAHEYAHAVVFAERVLRPRLPNGERKDEESWLSEGLSHLIERALVPDSPHLDHRLSAYCNDPERHRLVIGDYFAEKLWRDPGTRGAVIAFLEWCLDREPDLVHRLGRTPHRGIDNLEIAMQTPFEELFRAWAVSQVADVAMPRRQLAKAAQIPAWAKLSKPEGLLASRQTEPHVVPSSPLVRGLEVGSPFVFAGPRFVDADLAFADRQIVLSSTAVAYVRLHAPRDGSYRVTLESSLADGLQATLLPIADNVPHLTVAGKRSGDRITLTCSTLAKDLTLVDGAVEFARPGPRLFVDTPLRRLTARELGTAPIQLELDPAWRSEELIVKVVGSDRQSRIAAGWIRLQPSTDAVP
jgi:hypothetical protein